MLFREQIKQKRNEMKLSQAEAAYRLHISQSTLCRIEKGSLEPDETLKNSILQFYHLNKTDNEALESIVDDSQDTESQNISIYKNIVSTQDLKWIFSKINRFFFIVMIMLTFLVTGYGPVFACVALYIAVKNHYKMPVIILVILLAAVLTFFALDQHFNFLPSRVGYTFSPE